MGWILRSSPIRPLLRLACVVWSTVVVGGSIYSLVTRGDQAWIVALSVVGILSAAVMQFAVFTGRPHLTALGTAGSLCAPTLAVFYVWPGIVILGILLIVPYSKRDGVEKSVNP